MTMTITMTMTTKTVRGWGKVKQRVGVDHWQD